MTLHFYDTETARRIMHVLIDRAPNGGYVILSAG
jgi:hypothetical protein